MARGATMSDRATSAGAYWHVSSGRMSAPRIAVMTRIRIPAAIPSREASVRVKRAITGARWISIGRPVGGSMRGPVVRGEVGLGQATGDEAAHNLAVGAAPDAW